MKTRDISRSEWPEFFDSINRQHEGWLVTLEIFGSDIGAQVDERELALEGIVSHEREESHAKEYRTFVLAGESV